MLRCFHCVSVQRAMTTTSIALTQDAVSHNDGSAMVSMIATIYLMKGTAVSIVFLIVHVTSVFSYF